MLETHRRPSLLCRFFLCVLSFCLVAQNGAWAQVIAYKKAAGREQATVLRGGNGVPVINIQTPGAGGVSRNVYSQFDIGEEGAIFNNSRKGAVTYLAGEIEGNPWLSRGTAAIILNEIVSSDPSHLRGLLEVGGMRAEIIIANPSGIVVNGGGFLNASRATLTTGTPLLEQGVLKGYSIRGGEIRVEGGGLEARDVDYTAILARAAQISGALYADDLRIITGSNDIGIDHETVKTVMGQGGQKPVYALDVAQLGGMYANRIYLMGTENGVGVKNAGDVLAGAGGFYLNAEGRLENTGRIIADGDVTLNARQSVANTGVAYAGGQFDLNVKGRLDNSGLIGAERTVTLKAEGADGQIDSTLDSQLIAGLKGDGSHAEGADLLIEASQNLRAGGENIASRKMSLSAREIDLSGSRTRAEEILINARRAAETGKASSGVLSTDYAEVVAKRVSIEAKTLSNVGGKLVQTGLTDWYLSLEGALDNRSGMIKNAGDLYINALQLLNEDGSVIESDAALALYIAGHLSNDGLIRGQKKTRVTANSLTNIGLIDGSVDVATHLDNGGWVSGLATAGNIWNRGVLNASASARNTLDNSGRIGSHASAGGDLQNSGAIGATALAGGDLINSGDIGGNASAGNHLQSSGTIGGGASAGGDLVNSGYIGGNASGTHLANGGVIRGEAGARGNLDNSGQIGSHARAGGHLQNSGAIGGDAIAGGDLGNRGAIGGNTRAGGNSLNI